MLFAGFFFFALFIGFTLGASNTPVISTFLTSVFGLLGSVLGAGFLVNKNLDKTINISRFLGACLLVSATALFIGTFAGEKYRNQPTDSLKEKPFPWSGLQPPRNTYEALDWIMLREKLTRSGYTEIQVKELYKIRLSEIEDSKQLLESDPESEDIYTYNNNDPFNDMIKFEKSKALRPSRGPASE